MSETQFKFAFSNSNRCVTRRFNKIPGTSLSCPINPIDRFWENPLFTFLCSSEWKFTPLRSRNDNKDFSEKCNTSSLLSISTEFHLFARLNRHNIATVFWFIYLACNWNFLFFIANFNFVITKLQICLLMQFFRAFL